MVMVLVVVFEHVVSLFELFILEEGSAALSTNQAEKLHSTLCYKCGLVLYFSGFGFVVLLDLFLEGAEVSDFPKIYNFWRKMKLFVGI